MKEIKLKGIDEVIYYDECDNGLPIYMWVNDKVNNFYMTLSVKYGSIDTEFKTNDSDAYVKVSDGIAHFLEHVKFNESDTTTAHDYFNTLGSSINAFTTFNFTSYEVFASSEFSKNLNHLLDYVQTPYFTDALTEKEKGIICEEVKMGKNNPGHKLYYGMNSALYKKDKRRNLVTGEVDDVKGITTEELQMVFDTFYHPKNMFLVITGNFNPDEAVAIVKENQNNKEFIEYREPIVKREDETRGVNEEYKEIECNVEIPKVKIAYKMPIEVFGDIDPMLLNVYLSIVLRNNFGSTSLLREELLEKELVTSIGASRDIFNGLVTIEVGIETKYPTEVIPIVKEKMNNLTLTKEEIKRRIRANIAALINDYDDIEYVNSDICEGLVMYDKVFDDMYDVYNSLKLSVAKEVIDKIDTSDSTTVLLVPFKK
jgi:predicted Zn-dependent peptidase